MRQRLVPVLLLLWLCSACARPLSEAHASFDAGRYPEALAELRSSAPQLRDAPAAERFDYALYRGLTHLALGDARPAERWLLIAKRLSEASPGVASPAERGRLLAAWRAMGHMPGD